MDDDVRPKAPPGYSTVLGVVGVRLVLTVAPLADCPRCTTWDFFGKFEDWDIHDLNKPCKVCGGKRRTSLFRQWWYRRAVVDRS